MRPAPEEQQALTLGDYLRVVRRRGWIIVLATFALTAAGFAASHEQRAGYTASADVLLSRQIQTSLSGGSFDPSRVAETQASVAGVPRVAAAVLKAARVKTLTPEQFLAQSWVAAQPGTDLLRFSVTNANPALAVRLATEYAKQYMVYRHVLDTAALVQARKALETQIAQLEKSGQWSAPLYSTLVGKDQELRTAEALQSGNTSLIRPAEGATRAVAPKPIRNAVLGFGIGLVLGTILAFVLEALDSRVRSAEEISEALGLPLLARVPRPQRRRRPEGQLVMLSEPSSPQAEAFRVLRTNLELMNLDRAVRSVMVTSAVESEGKSTTVANLAVALARSGARVTLVDFDLRQPSLHHFFGIDREPGLTDVARGHIELDEALVPIALTDAPSHADGSNGHGTRVMGFLDVLPSGQIPPDPGEVVAARVIDDILERLRERADLVLMDSPPLLQVGDALALSAKADALVVVTRLNLARRGVLNELHRVLRSSPAAKLGFVLAGAKRDDAARRGYSYREVDTYVPREEKAADRPASF
jgi:capsular exopolysaccharide synthesis family protein